MKQHDFDEWVRSLTIVGDQAFLPDEAAPTVKWHRLSDEEREHYRRDYNRRRRADPEYRERERAYERARRRALRARRRAA